MEQQQNHIETKSMLPVGTLLQGGKYRIERYLSSGGFGNTYVATNTEFDEQVALKEFFMRGISEREGDSITVSVSNQNNVEQFGQQKDKFRKEARRLRKLRNDHIVAVHDLFEENGTAYYEMDLVDGESLGERLKRLGRPLSEAEVTDILRQVLDALGVVHAQGLYHLDLKPANIMIDQSGRALLIDFGASKQMHNADGLSVSTSSALAFTLGYAPLEQTEQNTKSFGPWTDLYALGATLYKLLTNQTPPSASELLMARDPLSFPADVSQRMRDLIAWMMKPRIDERPQSVAEVKRFLEAAKPLAAEFVADKPLADEETQVVKPKLQLKDEETEVITPKPQPTPKDEETESVTPPAKSGNKKTVITLLVACGIILCVILYNVVDSLFISKSNTSEQAVSVLSQGGTVEEIKAVFLSESLEFAQVDSIYSYYINNKEKMMSIDPDLCQRIEDYKKVVDALKNNAFESIRKDVDENNLKIDQKHRMKMFNYFIGHIDNNGTTIRYSQIERDERIAQFGNKYLTFTSFADLNYVTSSKGAKYATPAVRNQSNNGQPQKKAEPRKHVDKLRESANQTTPDRGVDQM